MGIFKPHTKPLWQSQTIDLYRPTRNCKGGAMNIERTIRKICQAFLYTIAVARE